ncbi:MAG: type II toxin-antitoxin system VapC family toxin [Acidimicrobiales bacterium]
MLVLDSGGLSRLSQRNRRAVALIDALRAERLWPPVVPTVVLAESTTGAPRTDVNFNRLLKSCDVDPVVAEATARRAGYLRARAGKGSAIDALLVALAEPGGTVLSGDADDLRTLAAHADGVVIERV